MRREASAPSPKKYKGKEVGLIGTVYFFFFFLGFGNALRLYPFGPILYLRKGHRPAALGRSAEGLKNYGLAARLDSSLSDPFTGMARIYTHLRWVAG
ncbi:MAG: hypothetical protein NZ958_07430 [Bacteroidia bacterium]|nr:hypothetical protein [Bacteroidia bacterium]MDW8088685.1 hypothetical protein [Bacteroidia bacterium]